MKIVCSVNLRNRLLATHSIKTVNKYVKSTLALCKHPKKENEFLIFLFTSKCKTGIKYDVSNNILNILAKFVHEGKITIQFKNPAHDFYIKGDPIQLRSFVHLLQKVVDNKISAKDFKVSTMSVTACFQKNSDLRKLVIRNRSEIPIKGFPRTLEMLYINGIGLSSLCIGVLHLQRLKILDLSENDLQFLPEELNRLPLEELNLAFNKLGQGTLNQWKWIGGTLSNTLKILNLNNNELIVLPEQFVKLQKLIHVRLENNKLKKLPNGFGNLRYMRTLVLANNELTYVPGSMKKLRLDALNIAHNNFQEVNVAAVFPKNLPVCSLKEYAARKVLQINLSYTPSHIPFTLVDYLDYAKYCVCGKACFDVYLHHSNVLSLDSITNDFMCTISEICFVPMDCYYCSLRCFLKMNKPPVSLNMVVV